MSRVTSKLYAPGAFSRMKEDVLVRSYVNGTLTEVPAPAVVLDYDIFSESIQTGGAHTVSGQSWTVQIDRCDWPYEAPKFGSRVTLCDYGGKVLTVQSVQDSRDVLTLSCVGNMAEADR